MTRLRGLGLLATSALLLLVASCGGSDDKAPAPVATQAPATAATAVRTPIGVPPVPPTATTAAPAPVAGGEAVAFQSADGAVTMRGNLYSAPGAKRKVVVIASYAPDTEAAWQAFAKEIGGTGIAALTFQMPVYTGYPNGTRDPALVDKDIESAVLFLESRDYPLIYVLGDLNAGVGALKLAAHHKLAGVITVSSPTAMGAANALPDVPKITVPKLFLAGQDSRSPTSVADLLKAAVEPKQGKVFDGAGTGVGLLTGPDAPAFKQMIRDFLQK